MVKERQSLETGILDSPTILKDNSTVWSCSLGVHSLVHGETVSATSNENLFVTMVSLFTALCIYIYIYIHIFSK